MRAFTKYSRPNGSRRWSTTSVLWILLAGCAGGTGCKAIPKEELDEVSWGKPFEDDFEMAKHRAHKVIKQEFKYIDPDLTEEGSGDLWSTWSYRMSSFYRESKRYRGRVVVEDLGNGKVRIGVAVMFQINDNIDNPSVKEEARWVATRRDHATEGRIERRVARRHRDFEVSATYKEKHREKRRETLREDLTKRYEDVELESAGKINKTRAPLEGAENETYIPPAHDWEKGGKPKEDDSK
ncbi:MAG: hypothetical protein V3T86_14240 [Planctomycetota bacterium]